MANRASPIETVRGALLRGEVSPEQVFEQYARNTNRSASRNTYLAFDREWVLQEAERIGKEFRTKERPSLFGLPVSLKDCFDLAGFQTTAGTRFYLENRPLALADSAVAERLRSEGAVITGKTHLHPLAYGITGENRDFGDCIQPADQTLLTGGSTSGGAASVQEGSAIAAIGTDTGGSIRVPAALCGLAGYRASIGLGWDRRLWAGGIHLAQSFDTLGWIFRDLRDAPLLAKGLFDLEVPEKSEFRVRKESLAESGATLFSFETVSWDRAMSIYAPIQASEAAAIHRAATGGDFSRFPPPIDERLAWGASLSSAEISLQRSNHAQFRAQVDSLFESFDFLILPCSPMSRVEAGKDHTATRTRILRYTIPMSLAGTPVIAIPFPGGAGVQLVAPRGEDARLLAYAARLAESLPKPPTDRVLPS